MTTKALLFLAMILPLIASKLPGDDVIVPEISIAEINGRPNTPYTYSQEFILSDITLDPGMKKSIAVAFIDQLGFLIVKGRHTKIELAKTQNKGVCLVFDFNIEDCFLSCTATFDPADSGKTRLIMSIKSSKELNQDGHIIYSMITRWVMNDATAYKDENIKTYDAIGPFWTLDEYNKKYCEKFGLKTYIAIPQLIECLGEPYVTGQENGFLVLKYITPGYLIVMKCQNGYMIEYNKFPL